MCFYNFEHCLFTNQLSNFDNYYTTTYVHPFFVAFYIRNYK